MAEPGFTTNEAWIYNNDLFGDNKIYLLAKSVSFGFNNISSFFPITKIDITESGETVGDSTNWERRKGYNSYNGFGGLVIKLNGVIDLDNLGAVGTTNYTITPGLLYTMMANGHRQYKFYDNRITKAWFTGDPDPLSAVQVPYTTDAQGIQAIPVVITAIDMTTNQFENVVNFSMTLREDRSE